MYKCVCICICIYIYVYIYIYMYITYKLLVAVENSQLYHYIVFYQSGNVELTRTSGHH